MSRLDRYIGVSVLFAMLAVLAVLLGLSLLFSLIDQLGEVAGGYGTLDAVEYVFLTSPRRLYELLPMGVLIGALIGLGTLASTSELTVMRAAGVSLARIVWAVVKPTLLLMVVGILIGEYLAPVTESLAQARQALAMGQGTAQTSKEGIWHRQQDEFIHINAVQPGGVLLGVTRYSFDEERRLLSASFARRAEYRQSEDWLLKEVETTHFRDGRAEREQLAELPWPLEMSPEMLTTVVMEPDSHSITGLWFYINYLGGQGLDTQPYWLAFWTKTLQPLVMIGLMLLAISFVFGPLRSVTLGQRIFTGVVVGFSFRLLQDLLGPASQVYGFSPFLAIVLPAALCSLAGLWLLRRAG